jgi:uncharacterized Zn-finger protein
MTQEDGSIAHMETNAGTGNIGQHPTQVRCRICGELLYDPRAREHYLEEDMAGTNHCPRCGATYRLLDVIEKSWEGA